VTATGSPPREGVRRPLKRVGATLVGVVIVFAGVLAGTGWLYVFRGLHWLEVGPRIADSLPLLQLASFDGQPLLRVVVAWLLAGLLTGVALVSLAPWRRALLTGIGGLVLLLLGSQAAYSLARNIPFTHVLFSRMPGLGPVVEAAAFALGSALPRPMTGGQRLGPRRSLLARLSGFDDRRLRGG
jgi:hypothetical protein